VRRVHLGAGELDGLEGKGQQLGLSEDGKDEREERSVLTWTASRGPVCERRLEKMELI
jgi:hypothetical protein